MTKFSSRPVKLALALSIGLGLSGCMGMPKNQSLDSIHQPVVQRATYALDLTATPAGLSFAEQSRLSGWFEAMDLRYGDRISVEDSLGSSAVRNAVETIASRHGMLVSEAAPVSAGYVQAGTVRVIVTRSSASVPGCPDWSTTGDSNYNNATSSNYGCATNSNLASMVADPEHLVNGARPGMERVVRSTVTSNKAIKTYRETEPTGKSGLADVSSQGGN